MSDHAVVTDPDAAYAAGFFDGEGHIRIVQHSARCRTFMLQVTLTQAELTPLDWFKSKFGGTTSHALVRWKNIMKDRYTWQASSAVAERFIRTVYPYLKTKKEEADVALKFRATFRPRYVVGGHKRMSEDELEARSKMKQELVEIRHQKRPDHPDMPGVKVLRLPQ